MKLGYIVAAVVALWLAGCAQVEYKPLEPPVTFEASKTAAVNNRYIIPVYDSPPARPFVAIGLVTIESSRGDAHWNAGIAARRGKKEGADAIMLLSSREKYMGTIFTGNSFANTYSTASGNATITPIAYGGATVAANAAGNSFTNASSFGAAVPAFRVNETYVAIRWR